MIFNTLIADGVYAGFTLSLGVYVAALGVRVLFVFLDKSIRS